MFRLFNPGLGNASDSPNRSAVACVFAIPAPVANTRADAGAVRRCGRSLVAFAVIPLLLAAGPAVTIHKIDDSVVTGELTAVADGKLTIHPASTQPAEIPLADVLVLTTANSVTATPAPSVAAAPEPAANPNMPPQGNVRVVRRVGVAAALLGALGGSATAEEVPAAVPTGPPAPKPAAPAITTGHLLDGVIELANGDHVHGGVVSWDDKTVKLQIADVTAPLELPPTMMTTVWINDTAAVAQAKALAVDAGPEDVAYVKKDAGVTAVKGLVVGVAADGVTFRYDDKDRKIDRAKIVGLVLRSNTAKPDPAFHQLFHTVNADAISGTWTGLEKDSAVIQTAGGMTIKLPMKSVVSIGAVNGRVIYVSDLKPTGVEQTPYFGRVIPYKLDQSLDGGPMTLSDGPHVRGIAVHSRCVLTYDIDGRYERFKTVLGFEQPAGRMGRVAVRILGDDKVLMSNPDLRGDQPAVPVDLDVTGVKKLVLEVDFGADQDTGDRVDWADARLTRAGVK
jgi:hypothetical protein